MKIYVYKHLFIELYQLRKEVVIRKLVAVRYCHKIANAKDEARKKGLAFYIYQSCPISFLLDALHFNNLSQLCMYVLNNATIEVVRLVN